MNKYDVPSIFRPNTASGSQSFIDFSKFRRKEIKFFKPENYNFFILTLEKFKPK